MDSMELVRQARMQRSRAMADMAGRALAAIAAGLRSMRAAWRLRSVGEDLRRQSDYLLRDIGLRRSQIRELYR